MVPESDSTKNDCIRKNERILFFGDSITAQGEEPFGYVSLVRIAMQEIDPNLSVEVMSAGKSGDRVPDLQRRLRRDVVSREPTIVVVFIGVNDVWHWDTPRGGTVKEKYGNGLWEIISRLKARKIRVLLCTPAVIGEREPGENPMDEMLGQYAEISRRVAEAQDVQLIDLHTAFREYGRKYNPENREYGILTTDGVHLNDAGNRFVARKMVEALTSLE